MRIEQPFSEAGRPLPRRTPTSAPYLDGAREGRLRLQRCPRDGFFFYPRPRLRRHRNLTHELSKRVVVTQRVQLRVDGEKHHRVRALVEAALKPCERGVMVAQRGMHFRDLIGRCVPVLGLALQDP